MDRYRSTRTEWLLALQNHPPDSSGMGPDVPDLADHQKCVNQLLQGDLFTDP